MLQLIPRRRINVNRGPSPPGFANPRTRPMVRRQGGLIMEWSGPPVESPQVRRERLNRFIAIEKSLATDIARLQKRGHVFGPPSRKMGRPTIHPESLRRIRQTIRSLRAGLR